MALRDQPYLPLYIQDFLTDEKLIECSASATGVYIRLMCIMHKSNEYGKILLQQKDKQTGNQISDFATKLAKHLPYTFDVIVASLTELLDQKVVNIDGDFLHQSRMVRDNELSLKRSKSGKKGGKISSDHRKEFATAKVEANTEYEYENTYRDKSIDFKKLGLVPEMMKILKSAYPFYAEDEEKDFPACLSIAYKIAKQKGWMKDSVLNGNMGQTLDAWGKIVEFSMSDKWYATRSVSDFNKEFQRIVQGMVQKNKTPQKTEMVPQQTAPSLKYLKQD